MSTRMLRPAAVDAQGPAAARRWRTRAARALTTVASALALAVGALTVAPAPAHAADPITTQEYFSYYGFDAAREKGYTGKGITIALFDGPVDTSAPELAGATIDTRTKSPSRAW